MLRPRKSQLFAVLGLLCAFVLGATLPGALAGGKPAAPGAVRSAFAQTDRVQGAPGRTMVLSRVVVDPGAKLALHHHLGTQVARVTKGTLTYRVREGSVTVRRGEADRDPVVVGTIAAGQAGRIRAGQWIVEQPSDVHEAANRGNVPVVIYLATLLKTGAPPSTPVEPPGR